MVANRTTGQAVPQAGDVTALRKTALETAAAAKREEAAKAKALAAEVEDYEARNVVIDYSGADVPLPVAVEQDNDDDPYREIIIKYPIEQMAFGREIVQDAEYDERGNITQPARLGGIRYFSFKEGRKYRVPTPLALHLDERGYVFH
jgi:hypothetical protein